MNQRSSRRSQNYLSTFDVWWPGLLGLQYEFYHWWLDVLRMRRFIRHPACVPLRFAVKDVQEPGDADEAVAVRDVSEGGLCFNSDHPVKPGSKVLIEIPVESPPFQAQGVVAWCRHEGSKYAVGVQFNDQVTRFSVRMVEQICHIERYRADVEQTEGRQLSSEEAAREWVERFARDFPSYG